MAQPVPQQQFPAAAASTRFGRVAAGGPIAEMQRTIEERMMATDWHATLEAQSIEDGAAHRMSRLAGPALLAGSYLAVALWWF